MLVSLRMAIESKDLQEIDRVYSEVLVKANQKLRSDKYTYFDLNNIEDSALRSLIAQSIVNAKTNDVEYTLEVKDIITPLSMELLDLVRVTVTVMGAEPSSVAEAVTGAAAPVSLVGVASAGTERVAQSSTAPEAAARARP